MRTRKCAFLQCVSNEEGLADTGPTTQASAIKRPRPRWSSLPRWLQNAVDLLTFATATDYLRRRNWLQPATTLPMPRSFLASNLTTIASGPG